MQTPRMNALVKEGIELDQAYSFKFCSPTRSSYVCFPFFSSVPSLVGTSAAIALAVRRFSCLCDGIL